MVEKILQLAVQIVVCLALLWLTKEMSGKFTIAHLVIAYILSFVLTKAFFYCMNQRKKEGAEGVSAEGKDNR